MIYADNNGSISNSTNDKNYWQTKYINIKHNFVKQRTKLGQVTFDYISSAENVTNLFIKPLSWNPTLKIINVLRLHKH